MTSRSDEPGFGSFGFGPDYFFGPGLGRGDGRQFTRTSKGCT